MSLVPSDPFMFAGTSLDFPATGSVVRALDQQILACVGEEALASSQQSKLLTWAHNHLLRAYAALVLDALALGARKPLRKHRINACDDGILALVYAAVCPLVA